METRKVTCVRTVSKPSNIKPRLKNWTELRSFVHDMDVKEDSKYYEFLFPDDAVCSKELLLNLVKFIWSHSDTNKMRRENQCVQYPTDSHIINIMWEDIARIKEQLSSSYNMQVSQDNLCNKLLEHYPDDDEKGDIFNDVEHKNALVLNILNKNNKFIRKFIKSLDSNDNIKSFMRNVNINKIINKIKPFISEETNPYLVKIIQIIDGEADVVDEVDNVIFDQLSTYIINDYANQIDNHKHVVDTLNKYEKEYEVDDYIKNNHRSVRPATIYTYRNVDAQVICLCVSFIFLFTVFIRTIITTTRGEPILKHWIIDSLIGIRVVSTALAPRIIPHEMSHMYIKKYNHADGMTCGFVHDAIRTLISIALLTYNKHVSLQTKSINGLIIEHDDFYEFSVKTFNVSGWLCYGISQVLSLVSLTGNIIFTHNDPSQSYTEH
jgi:hypothetical protein